MEADIRGQAALEVAESLMLLLIESGVLSADRVTAALEILVQHHSDLAADDDCADAARRKHAEISSVICEFIRGTNLTAARRPDDLSC
jgi:hypothetical protein